MSSQNPLHNEFKLFKEDTRYILVPTITFQKDPKPLVIDRPSATISAEGIDTSKFDMTQSERMFGIVGVLKLIAGQYLVMIKQRILVGTIEGHAVYKIADVMIIHMGLGDGPAEEAVRKQEQNYVKLVRQLLRSKDFYFSYTFDLSNTLARKQAQTQEMKKLPLYKIFDNRFFWNRSLQELFISKDMPEWVLPILRGIIQLFIVIVQRQTFDYILISRRSRFRAGTRYKTRGVDSTGAVANYVETEQIVCIDRNWLSFVQTRGSIPLVWEQSGIKYTPIPRVSPDVELNKKLFSLHFQEQLSLYNKQLIVNLLDQKGVEQALSEMYESYAGQLLNPQTVQFEAFDFHEKCRASYDNVHELITKLTADLKKFSFFHRNAQGDVVSTQTGAVRTNCLDCLDRTNLVQSFFGRFALGAMLKSFGINMQDKENLILERVFREAWTNNGDAVSLQYAGTGALKSDFTRTGQRETKGVLKDGVNSLSRYYINNFKDTLRQMSIDIFLGNYDVKGGSHEAEDDILAESGLWSEAQSQAVEFCTSYLEDEKIMEEEEEILNAWVVISLNKAGKEQERVFVVTSKAVYRVKYDYGNSKKPIERFKKLPLAEINSIDRGMFDTKKQRFGFILNMPDKDSGSHIYAALDFTRDMSGRIIDAISKAIRDNHNEHYRKTFAVRDTAIQKQDGFMSDLYNKLKLGMYNNKKDTTKDQKIQVADPSKAAYK